MKGLSIEGMKKHPSLIPLFAVIAVGCGLAGFYTIRLASRCPDVSWNKKESEPWNFYSTRQYKFYGSGADDTSKLPDMPKF